MDGPLVIRAAAFLVLLLAVLGLASGRSVGQEEEESRGHRRHRHLTQPGSHLQDPVKYDVGTPETAVKTAGPREDPPAPQNPPPPAKWEVISQAAQNIGRAVSHFSPARPASYVKHHVKDVPHDNDDDDDDDDDDDNDDDDHISYLRQPHDQVDLEDRDDHDVDVPSTRHHAPDVYSDEEILKITGTPSPALITSEEEEQLMPDTDVPEQLMQDDSAAAERLLRTEGARPKKEFKPVRMPTHFESYDLEPKDGFVTLQELVNITGARVNVHKAFNASDKNGDGLLDRREFYSAPWKLGPDWRYIPIDPEEDNTSPEEDDDEYDEDDDDDDDLYDDDDDDDDDDDEWDEWDKWDDDSELWDDMNDVDIF